MASVFALSQSLLLSPRSQVGVPNRRHVSLGRIQSSLLENPFTLFCSTRSTVIPTIYTQQKQFPLGMKLHVVSSDSKMPTTFTVDSAGEGIDVLPDSGGSNDDLGGPTGGGGSGGGGGGGNDGDNSNEGSEGSDESSEKKSKALSMSQKLTLGYAFLVGVGGLMGYLKSGSQKSLIAGSGSALILYSVYAMLPTKPVVASSIGFGMAASLLAVMGSRFKKSGKIFPAGIVSLASLVMSGGYLHGILRSMH